MHRANADRVESLERFLYKGGPFEYRSENLVPVVFSHYYHHIIGEIRVGDQGPFGSTVVFCLFLLFKPPLADVAGHPGLDPVLAEGRFHLFVNESTQLGLEALESVVGLVGTLKGGFFVFFLSGLKIVGLDQWRRQLLESGDGDAFFKRFGRECGQGRIKAALQVKGSTGRGIGKDISRPANLVSPVAEVNPKRIP